MVVMNVLRLAGVATVALIAGFVVLMWSRDRRKSKNAAAVPPPAAQSSRMPQTQILPKQASTMAPQVDALYFFLVALTAFFTLLVSGMVVYFAIKYRRQEKDEAGVPIHGSMWLEAAWTIIPLHHRPVHLRLEREPVLHHGAAARPDAGHLRGGQAVDVEVPASGRQGGGQRAARAGRASA